MASGMVSTGVPRSCETQDQCHHKMRCKPQFRCWGTGRPAACLHRGTFASVMRADTR